MTTNTTCSVLLLFVILFLFTLNVQYIQCTTTITVNDLLVYPNRYKKLFKIIHYLIRQCSPYCLNFGRLEKPDMPWKKCYCLCPDDYYGIACEFSRNNDEIETNNNNNQNNNNNDNNHLTTNMYNIKSNSLPFSYRHASSLITTAGNNNDQEIDDQQMIIVK
ncbi:hypothetical protein EWB00_009212 [Schistosoma japonicum]|uniref:EGF-like domain-containing protein n=1 Tax=Schistosoma japonicum TaxID=6182 RepID=A0A4Z2CNE4_SCHJA|nr:hypothetical protein EWB00_009212 [Schistosoma japonicum]